MWHPPLYVTCSIYLSVCPSIDCAPYLMNHTSSDHNFWHMCVKWWYFKVFCSFCYFFFFFGLVGGKGRGGGGAGCKRVKSRPNWKITITSVIHPYLKNSIVYDHDFWDTCIKWWYRQAFCSFFLFWFFRLLGQKMDKKGQKMAQKEKKLCLLCSISQEPYIIWLSSVVHKFKMMISPGVFFHFFKFWFFRLSGGSKCKKFPKMTKNLCLLCIISQEPYIIWSLFMVHICKRIISPVFFTFCQIFISGVNSGVKGQKWPKITENSVCLTLYLRNRSLYDCGFGF